MAIQQVTIGNNQVRAAFSGSIYIEDAVEFAENLTELIDQGHTTLLIDLADVDYIDSAGIGALIAIHKRALERNGGLVVKGPKGIVKELFELTHVVKVLHVI